MERCEGCSAEFGEGARRVLVTVNTEKADRTGFDREAVRSYFHKDPPLEVCQRCGDLFVTWDLARLRAVAELSRPLPPGKSNRGG